MRHPISLAGLLLATLGASGFLALGAASAFGLFSNPYAGLLVFIAFPALFVIGLLLIPLGARLQRRALARGVSVDEWPVLDFRQHTVRVRAFIAIALTVVNIAIVLVAGYGSIHWMESPSFCGQACHTQMQPQFASWQNTEHATVACVDCHVGEGARAFVRYKLAGVRQLIHVIDGNYPRPIPAHVADLRPANETCGHCHSPSRSHAEVTRVIREYADDETNSESVTELQLHVGAAGQKTAAGRSIHWHADPANQVEYVAADEERQKIPIVRVKSANGSVTEYKAPGDAPANGVTRVMDCIDCHNAIGHRVASTVESAVNHVLSTGQVSRDLPFVRREAVRLLKADYADQDQAAAEIDRSLRAFYASGRAVDPAALEQAVRQLQHQYRANVFPSMKVTWGTYQDHLGHVTSDGCFRCHDGEHTSSDGKTINNDCEYCHSMR